MLCAHTLKTNNKHCSSSRHAVCACRFIACSFVEIEETSCDQLIQVSYVQNRIVVYWSEPRRTSGKRRKHFVNGWFYLHLAQVRFLLTLFPIDSAIPKGPKTIADAARAKHRAMTDNMCYSKGVDSRDALGHFFHFYWNWNRHFYIYIKGVIL